MRRATLISAFPGYNLGLAKPANYLSAQGWQVEHSRQVYPLTDDADPYVFSVVGIWDVPRLIKMVKNSSRARARNLDWRSGRDRAR